MKNRFHRIEQVNKIIKYDYLHPKNLQNQTQLTNYLRDFVIPDYNDTRPHGSLFGLTPLEAYGGRKVDFRRIREKMVEVQDSFALGRDNYFFSFRFLSLDGFT